MALELQMRRRRRLSMTSLIDVIFLLLLFFMLTSTFSKFGDVELKGAGGGALTDGEVERVFVSMRPDGLMFNGRMIDADTLISRIKDIQTQGPVVALISLYTTTTSQDLVDVLAVLYGVPDLQVLILE